MLIATPEYSQSQQVILTWLCQLSSLMTHHFSAKQTPEFSPQAQYPFSQGWLGKKKNLINLCFW